MDQAETCTYRGTVRRVFFSNADGPYMAGVLATDDGEQVRFSGKLYAEQGDKLELVGTWGHHPKFGRQFDAASGVVRMDNSPDALAHLLASHPDFQGIGPARALKVVEAAMALTVDGDVASALRDFPDDVAARASVPVEVVRNAGRVWDARRDHFDALAALGAQGWTSAQATRIVAVLGTNAPSIVQRDPYALIGKVGRFGFRTVDAVARTMGIESGDPLRLAAGVAYCLDRIADDGNTWTTREGLLQAAVEELRPDSLEGEDRVRRAIQSLIDDGTVHVDTSPIGTEIVADARLAALEVQVFEALVQGLGDASLGELPLDGPRAAAVLPTLNEGQAAALHGFARHRFGVISGGAGVGKTYTMRAVCEVAEEQGLVVALCAPTGKAARKLARSTQREAFTIHRLLQPIFDSDRGEFVFCRNAKNPIEADLVVVDEVSMVDVRLMRSLLAALPSTCRLLLVGDHHQIPSVGPGAILRDLLAARARYPESVHVLTEVVRQAGVLARNTSAILDGVLVAQEDAAWGIHGTEKGNEEGAAAIAAVIVESLVTAPEPVEPFGRVLDLSWDVQVLAPMRKGPLGTYALNVHLQRLRQRLFGNPAPEPTPEGKAPKPLVGDRVIWTKNDYELDLFNGTQAVVVALPKGGAMELFTEDGREVTVPPAKRANVEVAWAMTIHKAQGSEWPFVLLVGSSAHWIMHDRNLLYTGASRAAEALTILGDRSGLQHFAREQRSAARQTFGAFLVHGWTPTHRPQPLGVVSADDTTPAVDI